MSGMTTLLEEQDFQHISIKREGRVVWATIDAPPVHIMTVGLYADLRSLASATQAAADGTSVLVLQSADPEFFIAHFDVEVLLAASPEGPVQRRSELNAFHHMCEQFRTMPVVTIAKVAGRVGGGGAELAASFDMRFGAHDATIVNQMEVPLGILPGGTGTQRLHRLVGRGRAMEIVLGASDLDARTAEAWGWLNRSLPADELDGFVDELARRIGRFPPHAVRAAKASVLAAGPDPIDGLLEETYLFDQTMREPATKVAMQRFLDAGGQTRTGELDMERLTGDM